MDKELEEILGDFWELLNTHKLIVDNNGEIAFVLRTPKRLSKKGVYKVYFVICDSCKGGLISLENEEEDTIQIGNVVEKRSVVIARKNESMLTDKAFKKSVDERVKICLGEL
jgi:predicted methyltransferase